jgi:hypothetical protein
MINSKKAPEQATLPGVAMKGIQVAIRFGTQTSQLITNDLTAARAKVPGIKITETDIVRTYLDAGIRQTHKNSKFASNWNTYQ